MTNKTNFNVPQMKCHCDKWSASFKQIISAQVFAANHRIEYTGNMFGYCPWCGEKLVINDEYPAVVHPPVRKEE